MRSHISGLRGVATLVGALSLLAAITAASAPAQGPGLPRTYQVQRIDSPTPALAGGFGLSSASIGDLNNDGEVDIASVQVAGTPNSDGVLWVHSGETGQLLDSLNAPDSGGPSGGTNDRAIVDRYVDRMGDIGSCANPPPASDADQTCDSPLIGPPDGANEILLGAEGVDVGGVRDVGRIYVIDGATLAVLKRVDMPPGDRQLVADRQAENPLPLTNVRGGFGRTVATPRGLPPCTGNAGVTDCPSNTAIPPAVRIGDMDLGGQPEVVVGANRFPERGSTAHPESHCATTSATLCLDAGRAYIYRGEDIAGTNPAVTLETPSRIIKNLAAQSDANDESFSRSEIFGHAQMPIGDVGACRVGGTGGFPAVNPGDRCSSRAATNVPDGKPEVVVASHRADTPIFNPDPAFIETGVSFLIDGATGAVLFIYHHPEPQPNALFGYTTRQTFPLGELFRVTTSLPDLVLAGVFQNAQNRSQAGRGYLFNGDIKDPFINRGLLNDPTPTAYERFSVPTEGVGDLVPDTALNEVLVGNFSSNVGRPDALTDLHFFNPNAERVLQTIADPDQQLEAGFGYQAIPLGDLNEDGFLDFASSSPRWDAAGAEGSAGVRDQGRVYIFRSDNSPAPTPTPTPTPEPTPTPTPTPTDTDGDGVPDATDRCPNARGPAGGSTPGCPVNAFTFVGKPKQRGARISVQVRVPGRGTVRGSSAGNATGTQSQLARRAGTVSLLLKLSPGAKQQLQRKRKLAVRIRVAFTPTGGLVNTKSVRIVLRR